MKKKVGILTLYYRTFNYGAQLQAYALQKAVSGLGYDCELICFRWGNAWIENFYEQNKGSLEAFEQFSGAIPHSVRVYNIQDIDECEKFYDIFITGSDQVWGVADSMPVYVLPKMLLSFVPDNKTKIAYAASMGGSDISERRKPPIKMYAHRLDAVSMREKDAAISLAEWTGRNVEHVLDPTLLLDSHQWDEIAKKPDIDGKYIFVYNIGQNKELDDYANEMAKKMDARVVKLSYSPTDTSGPGEFLGLIKHAEYVLINSYHGLIFSILFNKQFLCFASDKLRTKRSKNTRMIDLMKSLGIFHRFIFDKNDYENIKPIDYDNVTANLKKLREHSFSFLEKSLSIEKQFPDNLVVEDKDCYSCGVCGLSCPTGCIEFKRNFLGVAYPRIDRERCTNCGVCKKVCTALQKTKTTANYDISYYSAKNKDDDIRYNSSSGGVFLAVARHVIDQNGVVFGAKYDDDFSVTHSWAETFDEAKKFSRSKYITSNFGTAFIDAKSFLEQGRPVLYSGTPCQISALKTYLGKEYENLITLDFICCGVGVPNLLKKYLDYHSSYGKIISLNMRDKIHGYLANSGFQNGSMKIEYEDGSVKYIHNSDDMFYSSLINFYMERCHNCQWKFENYRSDWTVADFSGVNHIAPELDDDKGISIVIPNTQLGIGLIDKLNSLLEFREFKLKEYFPRNPLSLKSVRKILWRDYMHAVFKENTIERIYNEQMLVNCEYGKELVEKELIFTQRRTALQIKLAKFKMLGLTFDDEPLLEGKVIIYGAGIIGQLFRGILGDRVLCYVDRSPMGDNLDFVPIYKLGDNAVNELIDKEGNVTVIVTPVDDPWGICQRVKHIYPKVKKTIIAERLVEGL